MAVVVAIITFAALLGILVPAPTAEDESVVPSPVFRYDLDRYRSSCFFNSVIGMNICRSYWLPTAPRMTVLVMAVFL